MIQVGDYLYKRVESDHSESAKEVIGVSQDMDQEFENAIYDVSKEIREWVRFGQRIGRLASKLEQIGDISFVDEKAVRDVLSLKDKVQKGTADGIRSAKSLELDVKSLLRIAQHFSK